MVEKTRRSVRGSDVALCRPGRRVVGSQWNSLSRLASTRAAKHRDGCAEPTADQSSGSRAAGPDSRTWGYSYREHPAEFQLRDPPADCFVDGRSGQIRIDDLKSAAASET